MPPSRYGHLPFAGSASLSCGWLQTLESAPQHHSAVTSVMMLLLTLASQLYGNWTASAGLEGPCTGFLPTLCLNKNVGQNLVPGPVVVSWIPQSPNIKAHRELWRCYLCSLLSSTPFSFSFLFILTLARTEARLSNFLLHHIILHSWLQTSSHCKRSLWTVLSRLTLSVSKEKINIPRLLTPQCHCLLHWSTKATVT